MIHWYNDIPIFGKNVYGMYSARVNERFISADTLSGIKRLIRQHEA